MIHHVGGWGFCSRVVLFFTATTPRFCIKHGQTSLAFHRNAVQSFHRLSSALDLDLHGLIMKCGPSAPTRSVEFTDVERFILILDDVC